MLFPFLPLLLPFFYHPSIFPSFHSSIHLVSLAHLLFFLIMSLVLLPCLLNHSSPISSLRFHSLIYSVFPAFFPHCLSLLTLSFSQPLPPSVPLSDLSFSSVSTHYLAPSPSLAVWSAVFLLTLHGLVWCGGMGSCWLTHFSAQSSLQIESSYTNLCAFFYCWLFLLSFLPALGHMFFFLFWSACSFPSSLFTPSSKRERQIPWPSSFLSSLFTPPPPLLLFSSPQP